MGRASPFQSSHFCCESKRCHRYGVHFFDIEDDLSEDEDEDEVDVSEVEDAYEIRNAPCPPDTREIYFCRSYEEQQKNGDPNVATSSDSEIVSGAGDSGADSAEMEGVTKSMLTRLKQKRARRGVNHRKDCDAKTKTSRRTVVEERKSDDSSSKLSAAAESSAASRSVEVVKVEVLVDVGGSDLSCIEDAKRKIRNKKEVGFSLPQAGDIIPRPDPPRFNLQAKRFQSEFVESGISGDDDEESSDSASSAIFENQRRWGQAENVGVLSLGMRNENERAHRLGFGGDGSSGQQLAIPGGHSPDLRGSLSESESEDEISSLPSSNDDGDDFVDLSDGEYEYCLSLPECQKFRDMKTIEDEDRRCLVNRMLRKWTTCKGRFQLEDVTTAKQLEDVSTVAVSPDADDATVESDGEPAKDLVVWSYGSCSISICLGCFVVFGCACVVVPFPSSFFISNSYP